MIRSFRFIPIVVLLALAAGLLLGTATASAARSEEVETGVDTTVTGPAGEGTTGAGSAPTPRVWPNRDTCIGYARNAGRYLVLWAVGPIYESDENWAQYEHWVGMYKGSDCDYYHGNINYWMY